MKTKNTLRIGISLMVFCLLSFHCTDPNLPTITIVSPAQNAVIVPDSLPLDLAVELTVPVPGCGSTIFPVDPESFAATLTRLLDGAVHYAIDVTSAFTYSLNTETGVYTFTGNVELVTFGDYELEFTVENDVGPGGKTLSLRLEQDVLSFQGGYYVIGLSSLKQNRANCLMADWMLGIVYGIIKDSTFELVLPSGQAIKDSGNNYPITMALPNPLGEIELYLSVDEVNNDIGMDGPDDYTIDLKGVAPLPGFDCLITASADGVFNDMDPNDLDGVLTIGITSVTPSPGGQGCTLATPDPPGCQLLVGLDAE